MMLDHERIDPHLRPVLENFPSFTCDRATVVHVRQMMAELPLQRPEGLIEATDSIGTADGDVEVMIYRGSERPNQGAVLWIHGGGYIYGSAVDSLPMRIAVELDCTVFSVEYRLAPEHSFPAGPEDCYAALRWLMSGQSGYDVDLSRVVLGGNSAGGGMAAGVALMNRDREDFPLALQLLMYPMIDNLHDTASGAYENHPIWTRATSFSAWEMYLDGTPGAEASPYAAASRATDLSGLPPAYICVGTEDLFRDEDIDYAQRLLDADVPTELALFPGMYHGAEILTADAPVCQRLTGSFMAALASALG